MRAMEHLQLDPVQISARSHDITLQSRVVGYTPGMWEDLTYQQRKFFDWGGWLAVRPMDELPHWRVVMRSERDGGSRIRGMARDHADAIVEMRAVLREHAGCKGDSRNAAAPTRRCFKGSDVKLGLMAALSGSGRMAPFQLKQPMERPTMRLMFQCLEGISMVRFLPLYSPPYHKVAGLQPPRAGRHLAWALLPAVLSTRSVSLREVG